MTLNIYCISGEMIYKMTKTLNDCNTITVKVSAHRQTHSSQTTFATDSQDKSTTDTLTADKNI